MKNRRVLFTSIKYGYLRRASSNSAKPDAIFTERRSKLPDYSTLQICSVCFHHRCDKIWPVCDQWWPNDALFQTLSSGAQHKLGTRRTLSCTQIRLWIYKESNIETRPPNACSSLVWICIERSPGCLWPVLITIVSKRFSVLSTMYLRFKVCWNEWRNLEIMGGPETWCSTWLHHTFGGKWSFIQMPKMLAYVMQKQHN